jgi:hypothetical protein
LAPLARPARAGRARPGGLAGEDLRGDHLGGFAVLRGEPVISQVQVDAVDSTEACMP